MTRPGAWCIDMGQGTLSPERLTAHFFPERPSSAPALTLNALCGPRFDFRRRLKPGEKPIKCSVCAEKADA